MIYYIRITDIISFQFSVKYMDFNWINCYFAEFQWSAVASSTLEAYGSNMFQSLILNNWDNHTEYTPDEIFC